MKWKKSKRFQKLFAFALAVWMACLPVSASIPVAYAAVVSTGTKEVPFELNSEAELIEASINDTDNAGITYNASDKKVTIPSGAPAAASVELKFTFKLLLTKEAEVYTDDAPGETTMVSSAIIKENGTYFRKYTCKYTAEVGELLSLTDMKIVPKLNIVEASTGTIQFLDEAGQSIADISAYADVTYADSAWQKTGWTYYRSVDGADDGAQVTITPKPQYEYASCSLDDGRVVKNNNGSVTLRIRDENAVTVTLKPLTVSAPEANALVWTDEFAEEHCNSKSKTVTVTLPASEEAVNRGYVLQYWKCTNKEDTQTTGAAFRTYINANGDAYSFVIDYPYDPNDTVDKVVYIAYRYKKELEDGTNVFSDIVWNDTPIRSDFAPPSGSEIQVEANGKTVWTQDAQAPTWINQEQESSCAVKLKIVDAMSGGGKITYGMKDGSGNAYAQNQESQAVNNVCTIPYTTSVLLGTSADTVELTYTMQDKAGNVAAEQTVTLSDMVQFDLTAPTVTAAYQDASGQPITDFSRWQTGEVQVVITVEDPVGTDKERVSGIDRLVVVDAISGAAEDISDKVTKNQDGTYTLRLTTDAVHQLSIAAYDKAGNRSAEIKNNIRIGKNGNQLSTVSTEPFTIFAQAEADSGISENLIVAWKSAPAKKSVNDNARDVDNDTQIVENAEAESIETDTEENAEETEAAGAASDTADTDGSENRRNNTVLPLVVAGSGGAVAVTGGAYWFLKKKRL